MEYEIAFVLVYGRRYMLSLYRIGVCQNRSTQSNDTTTPATSPLLNPYGYNLWAKPAWLVATKAHAMK